MLAGGLAGSRILDLKRESMMAREFQPGFRIDLHHKDMGIALDAAREADVALPVTGLVAQLVAAARAQGYGSLDHSALLKVVGELLREGPADDQDPRAWRRSSTVLESEGVDTVFGMPGRRDPAALHGDGRTSGIEHLIVRHEEGATHMADGWSRTTGKVGVCDRHVRPGRHQHDHRPLHRAGRLDPDHLHHRPGAATAKLHQEAFQAVDIVEIAKPVTKWAVQVKEAAQAPWIFREAFRIARSGRPGPVLIDLPIDVQKQEIE